MQLSRRLQFTRIVQVLAEARQSARVCAGAWPTCRRYISMHSEGQNSYRKEMRRPQETQADYYRVLGVSTRADTTAIKKAYHELAKKHHPDVADPLTSDPAFFQLIAEAYSVLSDGEARRDYDMQRRAGGEFEFADGPGPVRGAHGVRSSEQEAEERLRQRDRQAELRRRNEGLSVPGSERDATPGSSTGKAAQSRADVSFRQAMARHTQRMRKAADARGLDQRARRLQVDVPATEETASILGAPLAAVLVVLGIIAWGAVASMRNDPQQTARAREQEAREREARRRAVAEEVEARVRARATAGAGAEAVGQERG